jgi:hypothetical protein
MDCHLEDDNIESSIVYAYCMLREKQRTEQASHGGILISTQDHRIGILVRVPKRRRSFRKKMDLKPTTVGGDPVMVGNDRAQHRACSTWDSAPKDAQSEPFSMRETPMVIN